MSRAVVVPWDESVEVYGFTLHKKEGVIVAMTHCDVHVRVGQKVWSNGRMLVEGIEGVVDSIEVPMQGHRTSDIIMVVWADSRVPQPMKLKDLRLS